MTEATDFWSRRKAAVKAEEDAELRLRASEAEGFDAARAAEEADEKTDDEILAELNLKHPDDLEPGDDFSAFLQKSVPERLRRRALRKLWLSNPVLANLDDLVEYGEDYTDAATVIESLQTTYQVGKGMLKHVMAIEEQNEIADGESAHGAEETDQDAGQTNVCVTQERQDASDEVAVVDGAIGDGSDLAAKDEQATGVDDVDDPTPPDGVRRRMRFEFVS